MRIINSKIHAILDYVMLILLFASPWLFAFFPHSVPKGVVMVVGAFLLIVSMFTNYEAGFKKMLSLKTHIAIDTVSGLFLAFSPWLLNFSEQVYIPHLVIGLAEAGIALISQRLPLSVVKNSSRVDSGRGFVR